VKALDQKLLRDLLRLRTQAITIALVVACGCAALVAALATYHSLQAARDAYYEQARFADVFANLKRAPLSVARTVEQLPGIVTVEPRVVMDVILDVPTLSAPAVGHMVGIPRNDEPRLNRLLLREGRWIAPGRDNEVIVSEGFANANALQPGDRVRALLNGKYQELAIVGVALSPEFVYALRAGDPLPDDKHFGILWMDNDALAAVFDLTGAFNDLTARIAPGTSLPALIAQLDRLLAPYGCTGAYGRSEQMSNRFIADEIAQQYFMASTIPPIFLLVAAFLLNVVLARTITTQREQIATLKALGYEDSAIVWHYVKMVALVTLLGVALGIALGAWFGQLMTDSYKPFFRFPDLPFRMESWMPVLAAAVSLVAALTAAVGAVRRILSLTPADAMRPPTPRVYRRSPIDTLGITQRLTPVGQLIARALFGRPLRTSLTILGVALALPITITGLFWRDAIDYMMRYEFEMAQRADAVVQFTNALDMAAAREIAQIPGVTRAEGLRAVAVRLRAGSHSYRTAIVGLPADATLRRVFDARQQPVLMPEEGIVLNDRLAKRLGVVIGSTITVEVQEGARPIRDLKVQGLTTEMLGLSAYMSRQGVNRLMQESDVVSAVMLEVDANRADGIYSQLKTFPRVATVGVTARSLKSFLETTAALVLVFTSILTLFAVVIAVGVVYNNARIALAERAWELASLRVLGFTRAEVSRILLIEQAIPILIAIPLGWWLGYAAVWAMSRAHLTEMFQIPAIIDRSTYGWSTLIILAAAFVSALVVRQRIDRLDLVSVLKVRE
jgi:putative ABC transport system permease protein